MKSTISKENTDSLPYPKLMVDTTSGDIFLMQESAVGTCIYRNSGNFDLGRYMITTADCFQDFKGTLTLSNS